MTNREIFDTVKAHLLKQMKQAVNSDGGCMYRGMEGTKCAIGCLIPDHLYTMSIEHSTMTWLFDVNNGYARLQNPGHPLNQLLREIGFTVDQYPLLSRLQSIHDCQDPENWAKELDLLEEKYFTKAVI